MRSKVSQESSNIRFTDRGVVFRVMDQAHAAWCGGRAEGIEKIFFQ
jgi:hypothetical protein